MNNTESPGVKTSNVSIKVASIFVDDQAKALAFYTEKLGLEKKEDIPLGGEYRYLTVVAPGNADGMELLLEPNAHAAAQAFQKAIFADGIPATSLFVQDINQQVEQMKTQGVEIKTEPFQAGDVTIAVFDDTCGNLIQLVQQ